MFNSMSIATVGLVAAIAWGSSSSARGLQDGQSFQLAQSCQSQCQATLNRCINTAQSYINSGKPGFLGWPCHDDCRYAINYSCQEDYKQCVSGC